MCMDIAKSIGPSKQSTIQKLNIYYIISQNYDDDWPTFANGIVYIT